MIAIRGSKRQWRSLHANHVVRASRLNTNVVAAKLDVRNEAAELPEVEMLLQEASWITSWLLNSIQGERA